jgi:hypothetical protein
MGEGGEGEKQEGGWHLLRGRKFNFTRVPKFVADRLAAHLNKKYGVDLITEVDGKKVTVQPEFTVVVPGKVEKKKP